MLNQRKKEGITGLKETTKYNRLILTTNPKKAYTPIASFKYPSVFISPHLPSALLTSINYARSYTLPSLL